VRAALAAWTEAVKLDPRREAGVKPHMDNCRDYLKGK
jgi:hypothetical protein